MEPYRVMCVSCDEQGSVGSNAGMFFSAEKYTEGIAPLPSPIVGVIVKPNTLPKGCTMITVTIMPEICDANCDED